MAAMRFALRSRFGRLRQATLAFRDDTRGVALVETAILLPFLLLLSAGVFEFGALFYQRLMVEEGVRDAARYLARCNETAYSPSPCSDTIAKYLAVYGNTDGPVSGSPRVPDWTIAEVTITTNDISAVDANSGDRLYRGGTTDGSGNPVIQVIDVTTSLPYSGVGFLSFLGINSLNITAQHEERKVGW